MSRSFSTVQVGAMTMAAVFAFAIETPSFAQACLEFVGSIPITGYKYDVKADGDYAYVTVDLTGFTTGSLRVIDVSDITMPVEVGFFDTPGRVFDVAVADGFGFVADHDTGVWVVDISEPKTPTEVALIDTPGFPWGVEVADGYLYIADGGGIAPPSSLRIIDVSDPA